MNKSQIMKIMSAQNVHFELHDGGDTIVCVQNSLCAVLRKHSMEDLYHGMIMSKETYEQLIADYKSNNKRLSLGTFAWSYGYGINIEECGAKIDNMFCHNWSKEELNHCGFPSLYNVVFVVHRVSRSQINNRDVGRVDLIGVYSSPFAAESEKVDCNDVISVTPALINSATTYVKIAEFGKKK